MSDDVVRYLAAHGAKIEVWNRKDKQGWTPLIIAQGQANAQKAQATTLTPEFLQLQAVQKWNGQLPQYLTPNTPLPFIGSLPAPAAR